MSITFLLAVFLLQGQQTGGTGTITGTIAGTVAAPPPQKILGPVQVILLSQPYSDLWNSDVQKRLDVFTVRRIDADADESVYVRSPIPQFLQLKKTIP